MEESGWKRGRRRKGRLEGNGRKGGKRKVRMVRSGEED